MNAYVVQMGSKPRKEGRCCKDVAVHQNSAKDDDHDHAAATIAAAQHCSSSQAGREGSREAWTKERSRVANKRARQNSAASCITTTAAIPSTSCFLRFVFCLSICFFVLLLFPFFF
jgi:pyruvate/2-oxoglutarate dehydrogenase complex dihydrolipoamide acyltransferase (E2) component